MLELEGIAAATFPEFAISLPMLKGPLNWNYFSWAASQARKVQNATKLYAFRTRIAKSKFLSPRSPVPLLSRQIPGEIYLIFSIYNGCPGIL
jgi:hypothetical protein